MVELDGRDSTDAIFLDKEKDPTWINFVVKDICYCATDCGEVVCEPSLLRYVGRRQESGNRYFIVPSNDSCRAENDFGRLDFAACAWLVSDNGGNDMRARRRCRYDNVIYEHGGGPIAKEET